jgi:hypothetical protein
MSKMLDLTALLADIGLFPAEELMHFPGGEKAVLLPLFYLSKPSRTVVLDIFGGKLLVVADTARDIEKFAGALLVTRMRVHRYHVYEKVQKVDLALPLPSSSSSMGFVAAGCYFATLDASHGTGRGVACTPALAASMLLRIYTSSFAGSPPHWRSAAALATANSIDMFRKDAASKQLADSLAAAAGKSGGTAAGIGRGTDGKGEHTHLDGATARALFGEGGFGAGHQDPAPATPEQAAVQDTLNGVAAMLIDGRAHVTVGTDAGMEEEPAAAAAAVGGAAGDPGPPQLPPGS